MFKLRQEQLIYVEILQLQAKFETWLEVVVFQHRWFVILNIYSSVSDRKPKMTVCGVNSGRFKSAEKNILS